MPRSKTHKLLNLASALGLLCLLVESKIMIFILFWIRSMVGLEKQYFYCRFVHEHYVFIVNFDHGYLIVPRTSVIRENPVKISIVNTHFPFSIRFYLTNTTIKSQIVLGLKNKIFLSKVSSNFFDNLFLLE